MTLVGAIEAGGTKFVCAVARNPADIRAETRFSTRSPGDTIKEAIDFFREYQYKSGETLMAIGIACFGPLDLNPKSQMFGYITTTPKPGWMNTDMVSPFFNEFGVPVAIDTDVNTAALGEYTWGSGVGIENLLYITVGTGIGGGAIINGSPVHGMIHPEMGHLRIPHNWQEDPFPGDCPFHGDCLEGLSAGPALQKRWKVPAQQLPPDHPAWDLEAHYLALALHNIICTISPGRIILGGGVMEQIHLFPRIQEKVKTYLNQYIKSSEIYDKISEYIVPPGLKNKAGVLGAVALAQRLIH